MYHLIVSIVQSSWDDGHLPQAHKTRIECLLLPRLRHADTLLRSLEQYSSMCFYRYHRSRIDSSSQTTLFSSLLWLGSTRLLRIVSCSDFCGERSWGVGLRGSWSLFLSGLLLGGFLRGRSLLRWKFCLWVLKQHKNLQKAQIMRVPESLTSSISLRSNQSPLTYPSYL